MSVTANNAKSIQSEAHFAEAITLLRQGAEEGVYPGAVILIGKAGEVLLTTAVGKRSLEEAAINGAPDSNLMRTDTVFDIAALTNIVATTTLIMKLVEIGKLKLEDKVARYIQGFGVHGKSGVSIEHLLNHTSGLVHWVPYFEELLKANTGSRMGILTSRGAKEYIVASISRSHLKFEPGSRQVYSELGFILLGHIVETLTGLSLDKAAQRYVFQPLGLKSTSYVDLSMIKRRGIHPVTDLIAPTEECPWRKRVLCGEVHDDNAWAMGGIAGHSGLFSSARDLHLFAKAMIESYRGESTFLRRETVARFWSRPPQIDGPRWCAGWEIPSRDNDLIDTKLAPHGVGHGGFTGCSLWIEPTVGIDIILLTNRIHPSRSNKKIFSFRTELHNAVLDALTGL